MAVLELDGLTVTLKTRAGTLTAVDGVSLAVDAGETLAIVGESGCGKSLTALAVMRLLPTPPAEIAGGRVLFGGRDLTKVSEREIEEVRGRRISMIFQDPMTSLNPVRTVGDQIGEVLRRHLGLSGRGGARARPRAAGDRRDPGRRRSGSTSIRTSSPAAWASA